MCEHFDKKQCDCLNGVCYSFESVRFFYGEIPKREVKVTKAQKKRLKEIAPSLYK